MNQERILSKIKKLLALSKSDNPNEAAIALNQAQKLMQAYNINIFDVEIKEEVNPNKYPLNGSIYICYIAQIISEAFAVRVLRQENGPRGKVNFIFVGTADKAEVASYFFDVLIRKAKTARQNKLKELAEDLKYVRKATKTRVADSFCMGWCAAVQEKLEKLVNDPKEEALIEDYFKKQGYTVNNKQREKDRKKADNLISSAAMIGYSEGKKVDLFFGVKGQGKKQEMLGFNNE